MKRLSILILFLIYNISFSQNLQAELSNLNFSGNGNPKYLTQYNGEFIFSANRFNFGNELWKFNPTTSTKTLLKKFINNSSICIKSEFISYNNLLYFIATDTTQASYQLWVTDGTPAGTLKIQTIANPSYNFNYQVKFKITGNKLFIIYSNQLWVSDGTTIGTKKIAQFNDINGDLYTLGNNVYFTADDGISGFDIWKSDGTATGTTLLKDINPSNTVGEIVLQPFNNKLYFFAVGNLWESDGTEAGTQIFQNIYSTSFRGGVINGKMVFYTSNYEVWSTDGSSANTLLLGNVYNASGVFVYKNKFYLDTNSNFLETNGTTAPQISADFGSVAATLDFHTLSSDKNYVIFTKSNQIPYTYYPKLISDGNLQTIQLDNSTDENSYLEYNGNIYYSGKKDMNDSELFKFNYVNNIYENVVDIDYWQDSKPRAFQTIGNNTFFTAINTGNRQQAYKRNKSTGLITQLSNFNFEIGNINRSIIVGNYYYAGSQNSTGFYRTDGTSPNTEFLNIGTQTFSGFYKFDDNSMIFRTSGSNATRIWKVQNDGTPQLLKQNVDNLAGNYQNTNNSVKLGNNLYFIFKENSIPTIYRTDGTIGNTSRISNFSNLNSNSVVDIIGKINNQILYFKVPNPYSDYSEVWISDGTNDGTLLQTFTQRPRTESIIFDSKIYFIGYKSGFSFLMVSDGTSSGTQVIKQIGNGESSAYNYDQISPIFSYCGNNLYIANFGYKNSLWKTDGTALGTVELAQHSANDFNTAYYTELSCAKNYLYFLNTGSDKIWRTDGTVAGTLPLSVTVTKNGQPDVPEHQITGVPLSLMYSDGDNLFFNSYTDISGWELYTVSSALPTLKSEELEAGNSSQLKIELYPNPVVRSLHLKTNFNEKIDKVEIFELSGKRIKISATDDNSEVNVAHLSTGVYIIRIFIKDKILSRKFIKK